MQHPLSKSPISHMEIGDFVACGRVIEGEGSLQTGPLHTSPAKAFVQFFQFRLLCNRPFCHANRELSHSLPLYAILSKAEARAEESPADFRKFDGDPTAHFVSASIAIKSFAVLCSTLRMTTVCEQRYKQKIENW